MLSHLLSLLVLFPVLAGPAFAYQDEEPPEPEEEPICDPTLECPQFCAQCPLVYDPKPYPKRTVPNVFIGWANGATYNETGLFGPMLIPIEIASQDTDEIHIKCAGGCQRMPWCGDWTIDWQVMGNNPSLPYPYRNGSFVTAQAQRLSETKDRWAVLYLPPEDLGPGESRTITLQAKIRDLCPEGIDQVTTIDFTGNVKRIDGGMWEVSLDYYPPNIPDETQEECEGSPEPCELAGFSVQSDSFPEERYRDLPLRMYVDEVRALTLAAKDCDKLFAECGIPTQFCSTFCRKKICDEVSYVWWVSQVNPQDTGQGEFEKFGTLSPSSSHMPRSQTVMFTATKAGKLRIYIQANSKSGDATVFFHDMEIFERKTLYVDHKLDGQHPIYLDGSFDTVYAGLDAIGIPGVEWIDGTDDGDALDIGDLNFPMAYTKGTAPELAFFAQSALDTPSMPGAIIYGIGAADTPNIQYISRLDHTLHLPIPVVLVGTDFQTLGALPDRVGRLEHRVRWEVTYVPTRPVSHVPEHPYRVYTTLTTPQGVAPNVLDPQYYRYWESAYDISCSAAQNATTSAAVLAGLNAQIATMTLNRKATDGANVPDGVQLRYWGEVGSQPYTSTCQLVGDMLGGFLSTSNGVGTCQAFAGLFKLCLALHGEGSVVNEFHAYLPPRRWNGTNTFIGPTSLTAYQLWFLVKDYVFAPPAGDTSVILYFNGANQLAQPPGNPFATNTDPDRARTFHHVDMTPPHDAPWRRTLDQSGKPGIGVTNPRSLFDSHALVEYGGAYYDPSYGDPTPHPDATAYAPLALDGVCTWDLVPNVSGQIVQYSAYAMDAFALWSGSGDAPTFDFIPKPEY